MDYRQQISQSFWQGLTRLVVLHQASQGPIYGGRLSKFLREQGYAISPGSLYPLLHQLEKAGLLQSRLRVYRGRARKYYEITPTGQACLAEVRREVAALVRTVILAEGPAPAPSCAAAYTRLA
jgi:PadR family transcriptional regulator PadR